MPPVIFLDSGVGGLPYYEEFHRRNPEISALYCADREHFPYGPRSKENICALTRDLAGRLIEKCSPALIVVACNAMSVSSLAQLRASYPATPFVGTVPAVKPAVLASKTRNVAVLGTERAVNEEYTAHLAENFAPDCRLTKIPAPELVEFVENRFLEAGPAEKAAEAARWTSVARAADADALVLACTHFLHLAGEFREAAQPDITVYDSIDGVVRHTEDVLGSKRLTTDNTDDTDKNGRLLIVTGDAAVEARWFAFGARYGLEPARLSDV
jgi:glutamate racemase